MINQPGEHPLSIGSAVQFTHKGKTIHGHLLQRQGRRCFAKVVHTAERTCNVPESMLKHSGGARRATIITRHDNARADYRVGDKVTFTSPDEPRRGEIVKCWGQPVVPNGLPLSKIHHAAFDAHLIGIDPDYRLHVSERLLGQHDGPMLKALTRLNGGTVHLPNRVKDHPDRDRLAWCFERFKGAA